MKKILMALASLLALGLFASCQQETSGDLTVSNEKNTDSWTYTYEYVPSGTMTKTTVTKTTVGSAASTTATEKVVDTLCDTATMEWTKYRKRNYCEYTITPYRNCVKIDTNGNQTQLSYGTTTYTIRKSEGSYYVDGQKVDVDPEASTVKLNFTTTTVATTQTGDSSSKTVTETTITREYNITLVRK